MSLFVSVGNDGSGAVGGRIFGLSVHVQRIVCGGIRASGATCFRGGFVSTVGAVTVQSAYVCVCVCLYVIVWWTPWASRFGWWETDFGRLVQLGRATKLG